MKKYIPISIFAALLFTTGQAYACEDTGFHGLTAALVNPTGTVSGTVDAAGCNIAIYYDHTGSGGIVKNANIGNANYYGVLVNGDGGAVNVDILNSTIHDIGEVPHNGSQHGVAIYYRGFYDVSAVTGKISGNQITGYQKGGIVINGVGAQANVSNNTVAGDGHVTFIAQNGIQIGYGASASVMRNTVSGNSYSGPYYASGGVLVVGGPGYGTCPDGNPCPYTVNTKIMNNVITDNDVGVWLSNVDEAPSYNPPASATNIKAVNNNISDDQCYNDVYQAGVSDQGNNDKIIHNTISGDGYACSVGYSVDASTEYTNRPKVHANQ